MADLLDEDYSLVEKNSLYRCLDKVLKHKEQLFGHLRQRWQDLFGARFEVLLYDLTSTYFESDPVFEETDKRQFGYSRDKRPDGWPKYAFFHRFKLYSLTSSSRATCRCVLPLWIINSTPWRLKSSPYLRAILLFFTVVLILL